MAGSGRNITVSTINKATTDTVATTPESSGASTSTVAVDLLLCDYVKLRKVRTETREVKGKITAADKKLQVAICVCSHKLLCLWTCTGSSVVN